VDRPVELRERQWLRDACPAAGATVRFEDRYGVTSPRKVKPLGVPGHRPRGGVDLGAVVEAAVVSGYLRGVYQPQGDYPAEVVDRALGYVEASKPPSTAEAKARMPAVLAYLDRRRRLGESLEVGGSLFAPDGRDQQPHTRAAPGQDRRTGLRPASGGCSSGADRYSCVPTSMTGFEVAASTVFQAGSAVTIQ